MESDKLHYNVSIIGGGPAGVATAIMLAARGVSHCIIEAQPEPTAKAGEALPPSARPLFRQLGIEDLLQHTSHSPYYGNMSCWGSNEFVQEEFIHHLHGHGYLLNRQHFESQLQSLMQKQATKFYSAYRLQHVEPANPGIKIEIANGVCSKSITSDFVVDATGRKASVCRRLGIEKEVYDDQFALSFRVKLKEPMARQIYIEAIDTGWWYAAPFGDKEMTLMFFTAKDLLPTKPNTVEFLQEAHHNTQHMPKSLDLSQVETSMVKVMPAGTSSLQVPYGENWLAVGDAAYAYDPISSYGITSALASGYYAGHALSDHLAGQRDALVTYRYIMEKAFQGYLEKLFHQYDSEKRWSDGSYWKNRFPKIQPESP
ncbi:NAD(P)/FAD-dependent oxidoreductase [Roseivirga sp. E12]|uniref:NAD(P)/FAD-dependent oxidoreductase n=1 Tax=Roseivirga sp. E12 TaxID=2819237 RepID=UPI001ABBEBD3|nr:NAD(P)/FAD-dependent oxidoreductase [Roseivirga sp. E12]